MQFPLECPRRVQDRSACVAALRRRFLCSLSGLAACGGGVPSDAVVQVNGQPITKTTFEHWLGVAASASAAAVPGQKAPKPVVPDPPDVHQVHRPPQSDRTETRQGSAAEDRSGAQDAVRTAVQGAAADDAGLPDLRRLGGRARPKNRASSSATTKSRRSSTSSRSSSSPRKPNSRNSWRPPGRPSPTCCCA